MKRYFFDVNIVLDLLLERQPHCLLADQVYNALVLAGQKIYLSSSSLAQIDYLVGLSLRKAGIPVEKKTPCSMSFTAMCGSSKRPLSIIEARMWKIA